MGEGYRSPIRRHVQHPDPVNLPRLLRLGGARRGEEANQGAEECSAVHHSIT